MSKQATPETRDAQDRVNLLTEALREAEAIERTQSFAVDCVARMARPIPAAIAFAKRKREAATWDAAHVEHALHKARATLRRAWAAAPSAFDEAEHARRVIRDQADRMRSYMPKA